MGWSRNSIDLTWNTGSDTYTLAAGADYAGDDVTLTAGPWQREIMVKCDNQGTPASGDTVDFYWQEKGDPDHDDTDEYSKQGTYIGTFDSYGTDDFGDARDGGSKTFYISSEFAMGRLVAVSHASSNNIVVSAELIETIYTES